MIRGNFVTWSKVPSKVRLLPFCRNWEEGVLSLLMITFRRDGSQVFEKDIPRL